MGIKVLSLYDGMACGMLAMLGADLKVDEYIAYEINKYAIQTATHNFPMIQECGDVFKGDYTKYKNFDYLIGGSPCTYWSIAQKRDNRETTAEGLGWELFSQYVRALNESKPKFFIYENNSSMSMEIRKCISETFGFGPIEINSALVSAQSRKRLYWVGMRNDNGSYDKVYVKHPNDKGILLKDILNDDYYFNIDKKSCMSTESLNSGDFSPCAENKLNDIVDKYGYLPELFNCYNVQELLDKAPTLTTMASRHLASSTVHYVEPINITRDGKSQTIKAQSQHTSIANIVIYKSTCGASGAAEKVIDMPNQVGALPRPNGELSKSQALRVYNINAKSVTITSNGGGAGGKTGLYAISIEYHDDAPIKVINSTDGKIYTVYKVKNNYITIKEKQYPIKLSDGYYIIRKLSVNECKRLQTVPEWYEFPVSDAQAYVMLGNGWTIDVITHLINATLVAESTKHLVNNDFDVDTLKYINKDKSIPKKLF